MADLLHRNFEGLCLLLRHPLYSGINHTVFWENEAKRSTVFKSKFGHWKLLRKWFWSYLELKNECSEHSKRAFSRAFANFWATKLKPFSGKVRQSVQQFLNQNLNGGDFLENIFKATLSSKMNILSVWKGHFSDFLDIFEWWSWNRFLGKWGKAFRSI